MFPIFIACLFPHVVSPKVSATSYRENNGKQTPEYRKFQNNFDMLSKTLINHVPPSDLASKLFAANLIGGELNRKANREIVDEAERINSLLAAVHNQIELYRYNFQKFITILKGYRPLTELIKRLE